MKETYYQWQNKHLLKTIYPLREIKLRDFLVHYFEIDIWTEYKEKTSDDIQDEATAYQAFQAQKETSLKRGLIDHIVYYQDDFTKSYDQEKIIDADQAILERLKREHLSFIKRFLERETVQSKIYTLDWYQDFVAGELMDIKKGIEDNKRNIRNVPNSGKVKEWQEKIETFEKTKPIAEKEHSRLVEFRTLLGEIDIQTNKEEFDQWLKDNLSEIEKIKVKIDEHRNHLQRSPMTREKQQEIERFEIRRRGIQRGSMTRGKQPIQEKTVTEKDIARWEVEKYKIRLQKKDHKELLEDIVKKFLDEPTRYPLWLQYMVIHFSGMRYETAYGSWANPKELLQKLVEKKGIQLDFSIELDENATEALSQEQALSELETLNSKNQLPNWMWKEIVALTPLKTKYATKDWEFLTSKEEDEKSEDKYQSFRETMAEWKEEAKHSWRNEHARSSRLIVSRSVCNEVAEQIQHLRGISPTIGLTFKPDWYIQQERKGNPNLKDKPFFKKAEGEHLKVGASILWLRWVRRFPNQWRIAPPIILNDQEKLIPDELLSKNAFKNPKKLRNSLEGELKPKTNGKVSRWVYENTGGAYRRIRLQVVETSGSNGNRSHQQNRQTRGLLRKPADMKPKVKLASVQRQEWLRWMHEATIAQVGETADGISLLTFETALPYDKSSVSTMGLKRWKKSELKYRASEKQFNGVFVGYVPEAKPPLENLKHMLDWQKIAPRMDIDQATIDQYWKDIEEYLDKPPSLTDPSDLDFVPDPHLTRLVEAAPEYVRQDKEHIKTYQITQDRNRPLKPRTKVRRGIHLKVQKTDLVINSKSLLQVVECEKIPEVVGNFVQEIDIIYLTEEKVSRPMEVTKEVNIQVLHPSDGKNDKDLPVFWPTGIKLKEKMKLRVSVVHNNGIESSNKNGIIKGDGNKKIYLILDCPANSAIEGSFIETDAVAEVSKEEYEAEKEIGFVLEFSGDPIPAWVLPELQKGRRKESAKLFRRDLKGKSKFPVIKNFEKYLPDGAAIKVGAMVFTKEDKAFYEILECSDDDSLKGFYIRPKEVRFKPPPKNKQFIPQDRGVSA